jgi:hypothetical protein
VFVRAPQAGDDIQAIACVVHLPTRAHWTLAVYVLEQQMLVHYDSMSEFQDVWLKRHAAPTRVNTFAYVSISEMPAFEVTDRGAACDCIESVLILALLLPHRVTCAIWEPGQIGNATRVDR